MDWNLAVVAVFLLAVAAIPYPGQRSRWRRFVAARLERLAARLRSGSAPEPDPFEALHLQYRLGAIADELRALDASPTVYAKAHRLRATRAAYDDLLEEACRLAGVPIDPETCRGEQERLREEVELTARGWSW